MACKNDEQSLWQSTFLSATLLQYHSPTLHTNNSSNNKQKLQNLITHQVNETSSKTDCIGCEMNIKPHKSPLLSLSYTYSHKFCFIINYYAAVETDFVVLHKFGNEIDRISAMTVRMEQFWFLREINGKLRKTKKFAMNVI